MPVGGAASRRPSPAPHFPPNTQKNNNFSVLRSELENKVLNTSERQTPPEPSAKAIPHTYQRNGVYYFVRRVPRAVRQHHRNHRILFSLRTRNPRTAAARAARVARQLDDHWFSLKLSSDPELGGHLQPPTPQPAQNHDETSREVHGEAVTMTAAATTYLKMKGNGRPKAFRQAVDRNIKYFISVCGDRDITVYQR